MLFRLALAMGRTINELRAVLSYAEFQEWCLYYRVEPWGEDRADLRAGIVSSTIANYAGKERSKAAPLAMPSDFMPYATRPEPPEERILTNEELAAWADAAVFGLPPE